MTSRGPPRTPSPTTFFAGGSPLPPITDDLDEMIIDALRHLPMPASRSEISAWLEANYEGFDHEAHSFDLSKRLRANVEKGSLSVERRYRLLIDALDNRKLKRASSTDRFDSQVSSSRHKKRTTSEATFGEQEQTSELYSSDESMDEDQGESVTPS